MRSSCSSNRPRRRGWPGVVHLGLSALLTGMTVAAEEKISYQEHVRPIFESACNNCHNPDKKRGGLDLSSYAALMAGGSSGEVVVAGAATDSRLFACVTRTAEPIMPPQGDPVPPAQLEVIKKWIDGGLIDAKGGAAKKAKKPAFSAQVGEVSIGKPDGPPPMPENLLLEPAVLTRRAGATNALAASPWAPLVALSGQRQVLLYHTDTLELAGVLPLAEGAVESLIFSRNGQMVIAGVGRGGKSGKLVAWDVKTGRVAFELGEERDSVLAADVSADLFRAALGGPSRRVKLYEPASGELVKDIKKHTDWVTALQFSPDGVLLASGDRAGGLHVWEAGTGNEFYTLAGHTGAITAVSWRADGNLLASASADGTIRLWEMNEGKEVKKWNAHGGGVQAMAFTHDGRLVSCGRDRHAKVWAADGKELATQNQFPDLPLSVTFTHDGQRFVVGDWSGRVSMWTAADGQAVGDVSSAPPSLDQRLAALRPELEKSRQAATRARDEVGSMRNNLTAARQQADAAKQRVEVTRRQVDVLEATLARAREAAVALLAALEAPAGVTPSESPAAPPVVLTQAEEWRRIATEGWLALEPKLPALAATVKDLAAGLPAALTGELQLIQAKEAEAVAWEEKAVAAEQALAEAAAALAEQETAAAHWEAAKVNVLVFHQRDHVAELTGKVEDATAELAAAEQTLATSTAETKPTLAEAQAAVEKARQAKAALEAELAVAQQALDAHTRQFLSMQPK